MEKMRPQVDDKEANMISQLPKRMRSWTDPTRKVFNLERDWVQFILWTCERSRVHCRTIAQHLVANWMK